MAKHAWPNKMESAVLKALDVLYVYTVGPRFLLVLNTQYMTNASEGWGAPAPLNTDGRPLPTKRRWRTSSKACAPHLLHSCASHFHLLVTSVQGVAMSTPAVMPFRFFVQTPIFTVSPSSFSLSPIQ